MIKKIFGCCSCCFNKPIESKVIILGLDNSGKTTLLYKIATSETVSTQPTIGYNVEEFQWKNIRFLMWDIGGQDALRPAWNHYFAESKVVIVVVDSTDVERLSTLKNELDNILTHSDLAGAAFLFFANKVDQQESITSSEITQRLGLNSLSHKWKMQSCCALTGDGLNEGLEWMRDILKNNNNMSRTR